MNKIELYTHLQESAKLLLQEGPGETCRGAFVASWVETDHPENNGSMFAGDGGQCVVLVAYLVDKIAKQCGIPYQSVMRDIRGLLRQIARERRKMGPGEELFSAHKFEIDTGDNQDDAE